MIGVSRKVTSVCFSGLLYGEDGSWNYSVEAFAFLEGGSSARVHLCSPTFYFLELEKDGEVAWKSRGGGEREGEGRGEAGAVSSRFPQEGRQHH